MVNVRKVSMLKALYAGKTSALMARVNAGIVYV